MYGKAFVDELLENAGISPRSGLPALRAPSTLQPHVHTIRRLALAAELRDDSTGSHIVRVGGYSALLAERLGLSDAEVRTIYYAALLHDVGKIGIPDRILKKRGKLSQEEFEIMKTHTIIGAKILADAEVEVLQIARHIAGCHHERWTDRAIQGDFRSWHTSGRQNCRTGGHFRRHHFIAPLPTDALG